MGVESTNQFEGFVAVTSQADVEVALCEEDAFEQFPHQGRVVGDQEPDHEAVTGAIEFGKGEFGEKVSFDLIEQLCGVDEQDQPSIGLEINQARDQPHLFGRQFGRRADGIDWYFHDLGDTVDKKSRDYPADRPA